MPTLWRVKFDDFLIWLVTFIATLFGGVQYDRLLILHTNICIHTHTHTHTHTHKRRYGMMVAIVASILALVRRASKASTVVELGRLRGTVIYRRFDMFPDSRRLMCRREHGTFYPLRIYRLDSAIHFGNTEQIEYVGVFFVVLVEYFERRFEYFERRFEYFEITITSTLEHTKHRYDLVRALQQISTVDSIEMSESFQQEDSKQRETEEKKVQEEENEDIVRGVIVLSCVAVNYLDTAGISMLRRFAESCEKENVRSLSEIVRRLCVENKTNTLGTTGTTLLLRLESELQSYIVPICTRD